MNSLEKIKMYLESDAGIELDDKCDIEILDNRLELIKKEVNETTDKDNNYYQKLISLIANYIRQLHNIEIKDGFKNIFDINGKKRTVFYELEDLGRIKLNQQNKEFVKDLFNYVCEILENNQDIELSYEILKNLLYCDEGSNKTRKSFYYSRFIDVINAHQTIAKSNLEVEKLYEILLNTNQLTNKIIFNSLIKKDEFHKIKDKLIEETLMTCDVRFFAEISKNIIYNFDSNFDLFSIIKKRNTDNFCEELIVLLLQDLNFQSNSLIHQILTDSEININYNLEFYYNSDLKSIIAYKGNSILIKDMLSKEENIINNYWYENNCMELYKLYAIIVENEKAITNFEEKYDYTLDIEDESGQLKLAKDTFIYNDSITEFLRYVCLSLKDESYEKKLLLIDRILNCKRIKYINIEELFSFLKEELNNEDFIKILNMLIIRRNIGIIEFIISDIENIYSGIFIKIATNEDIKNCLLELEVESQLSLTRKKATDNDLPF